MCVELEEKKIGGGMWKYVKYLIIGFMLVFLNCLNHVSEVFSFQSLPMT